MLTRKCDRCGDIIEVNTYYEFTLKAINARTDEDRKYNSPQDLCEKCGKTIIDSYNDVIKRARR